MSRRPFDKLRARSRTRSPTSGPYARRVIVWAEGTVAEIGDGWPGVAELIIEVDRHQVDDRHDDGDEGAGTGRVRALAYLDLVPQPRIGDRVLLNIAAQQRNLGTGGFALVVAVVDADGSLTGQPAPPRGHLVKARYTPTQVMITGVDEQETEFHDQLADADDLAGMPVIVADLHSALAPIIAAIRYDAARLGLPAPRIAYLMTDEAALPLAFSKTVARLVELGWLDTTITCGQAYGGDLEAVTVHTGLLAARIAAGADLVIASQGPGNLGTDTRWGFSGVSAGEVINAVSVLGGRPVGSLRISGADPRERHQAVSHHSLTAYGRVALRPADVALPDFTDVSALSGIPGLETLPSLGHRVEVALTPLRRLHHIRRVSLEGLDRALLDSPVRLSTMGRDLHGDPAYFLAAAAAGRLTVDLLRS